VEYSTSPSASLLGPATTVTSDGTLALKFQVQVVLPLIPSLPAGMLVQRKRDFYCSLWSYQLLQSQQKFDFQGF